MKNVRLTSVLTVACLLVATSLVTAAQTKQQSPEPKLSLGVSLSLPDGHFVGFPIQNGTPEEDLSPIPIKGYQGVFGIRMYPHMSGDKVAVRIWTMVPKTQPTASSGPLNPNKVPHEHRLLGDYVVGKEGDSLQIADFAKVGLPVLTAKVVMAPFSTESPADPCCCTVDGLFCCGGTIFTMCVNCAGVCPVCGGLKPADKLKSATPSPPTDAKPKAASSRKR